MKRRGLEAYPQIDPTQVTLLTIWWGGPRKRDVGGQRVDIGRGGHDRLLPNHRTLLTELKSWR